MLCFILTKVDEIRIQPYILDIYIIKILYRVMTLRLTTWVMNDSPTISTRILFNDMLLLYINVTVWLHSNARDVYCVEPRHYTAVLAAAMNRNWNAFESGAYTDSVMDGHDLLSKLNIKLVSMISMNRSRLVHYRITPGHFLQIEKIRHPWHTEFG